MKTTILMLLISQSAITQGDYRHPQGCSKAFNQTGYVRRGNRLELTCSSSAGYHNKIIYLQEYEL